MSLSHLCTGPVSASPLSFDVSYLFTHIFALLLHLAQSRSPAFEEAQNWFLVGKSTMIDQFIRNPIKQTDPTLDNRSDYRHARHKSKMPK